MIEDFLDIVPATMGKGLCGNQILLENQILKDH